MRQLIAIATVSLLLILGATILWGWPGAWALIALGPGVLLGTVVTHLIDAWLHGARPRLIFTTLAGSFGTVMALFAMMVMASATSPPERQVSRSRTTQLSPDQLWTIAAPIEMWERWEALVREARAEAQTGATPAVGARYVATMLISGREVPATLVVTAWEPRRHARWQVEWPAGSAFDAMALDLSIEPTSAGTTATFTLSYAVPSVTARAIERWALRPTLDASAAESIDTLVRLATESGAAVAEGLQLEAAVLGSFSDVEAAAWDRIVAGEPPFLEHAFLWGLEDTGCVGADTGWLPRPVVVRSGGELLGIAPAWLKAHSMGEFVYDWAWADAAQRAGVRYYPKLIVAAPFSPVPGSRLLVDPALPPALADAVRTMLLDALETVARDSGAAGLHLLFCRPEEVRLCTERGYAHRVGMQFHWQNAGYGDFEDFLARFRSKQRNQIRRERRQVAEQGVVVEALTGAEIPDALCGPAYGWYCATIERFFYGRQYLNEAFFQRLWEQMRPRLQLVVARHQGEPIAGSVNLQKGDERYGRYWGASERYSCVHFEVCTYTAVEDCIRQGIQTFQAGAGGGEHKYGRGFAPALTHSVHRLHHPGFQEAVEEFCTREATLVRAEADRLTEELFVR